MMEKFLKIHFEKYIKRASREACNQRKLHYHLIDFDIQRMLKESLREKKNCLPYTFLVSFPVGEKLVIYNNPNPTVCWVRQKVLEKRSP